MSATFPFTVDRYPAGGLPPTGVVERGIARVPNPLASFFFVVTEDGEELFCPLTAISRTMKYGTRVECPRHNAVVQFVRSTRPAQPGRLAVVHWCRVTP